MNRRIYIIAGEPSGDLHGAHLVKALRSRDNKLEFRGFGGSKMESVGVELDQTIDQLSFMGFSEVVKHLPQIFSNFKRAKKAILSWKPAAVVFIDFPGFNLRMAKWTHQRGFINFYYIAPQVWAWKEKRALKLKKYIDDLFCILPFEKNFFAKYDYDVHYVGHPLVDIIGEYKAIHGDGHVYTENKVSGISNRVSRSETTEKIIALLPGSRLQEVRKILPIQLQAVKPLKGYRIVIGKSGHIALSVYDQIAEHQQMNGLEYDEKTYDLMSKASLACVASGTATLETALFKVPEVVCFKGTYLSYQIARRVINVPYISLVNLIMNRKIVPELIQHDFTPERLREELKNLDTPSIRLEIQNSYGDLEEKLGIGGAAQKTAEIMISKILK